MALVLRPGSPVRIGPRTSALAALLTCGRYLPVGRAACVLEALAGIRVSSGFMAGVRGRAANLLERLPAVQTSTAANRAFGLDIGIIRRSA